MKLQRPLPQRGSVKARWAAHHAASRRAVMTRSRGKCEGCGEGERPLEWAHLAGRRHIVSEPWASSPELTAALCGECHHKIDRGLDAPLGARLRWEAAERLAGKARSFNVLQMRMDGWAALDVIRRLVDELEAADAEG